MRLASSLLLATAVGCFDDPNLPTPTAQDLAGTYSCFSNAENDCVVWAENQIPVTTVRNDGSEEGEHFAALLRDAVVLWNARLDEKNVGIRFELPVETDRDCDEVVESEQVNDIQDITASGVFACMTSFDAWDEYYLGGDDFGNKKEQEEEKEEPESIDPQAADSGLPEAPSPLGVADLGYGPLYGTITSASVFISPYVFGSYETPQELSVLEHELGHAAGLAHSENQYALMWPTVHYATRPTSYEIEGLKAMYGKED